MEDAERSLLEMLTCTVCQDIIRDPRLLPCGHSMCMSCLEKLMDHSSDVPFRCPDCRSYFGQIIQLQKSYMLTSIAEDFRDNKRRREEQSKNVYCDFCPEKNILAIKLCMKCEVSMCKEHVKDHQELPVFTGHPLVKPLGDLQDRRCPQHEDEVLRYYCTTSRRYICNQCSLESKQQNMATEASVVLRRQLTEYMDQHFTMLREQITESNDSVRKLKEDINHQKLKMSPAESCLNSVTVVLLCLWFIVLYYAYNFSVENQTLKDALDKQQTELLAERPIKSHTCPDTGDQAVHLDAASPFLHVSADREKSRLDYLKSNDGFDEAPKSNVISAASWRRGSDTETSPSPTKASKTRTNTAACSKSTERPEA